MNRKFLKLMGYCLIVCKWLCLPTAIVALPLDAWLGIDSATTVNQRFSVDVSIESVGDSVSYEPNLSDGGYAAEDSRARYQSARLGFDWELSPRLQLVGGFGQQQFTTKRDSFDLESYFIAFRYKLHGFSPKQKFTLSLGAANNRTELIDKNSYTDFDDKLLTSIQLHQPYDIQVQANAVGTFELTTKTRWSAFVGLGHVVTDYSSVSGVGESEDGCQYQFSVGEGVGSLEQLGPCGDLLQFNQQYPDYDAVYSNLGIEPDGDLKYRSTYWQGGLNVQFIHQWAESSFGYYYQHFYRGSFDNRIQSRGVEPVTGSHTLSARIKYHYSDSLKIIAGAEYNDRQFLNKVPVLYTGVTADRFSKDVLFFYLSLSFVVTPGSG